MKWWKEPGIFVPQGGKRSVLRWGLILLAATVAGGAILGVVLAGAISIPSVESMADNAPGLITEIGDRNGTIYQTYARQHRDLIEPGEIPEIVRETVLVAEDRNFYEHGGLDLFAILRSAVIDLRTGSYETGASTITMTLARSYFELTNEKRWRRKITEALIAVELEKKLSKEQILTLWLNVVNVGDGRYGFKEGCSYYFNKELEEIDVVEAATLAAILRYPAHTPYSRPELVKQRRDNVLRRMFEQEKLTAEEYEAAIARPVEAVQRRTRATPGRYFAEDVRRHLIETYGAESLYDRGLRAQTTLDVEMQRAAEHSIRVGLSALDRRKGWRGVAGHVDGDTTLTTLPSWPTAGIQDGEWYEGLVISVGSSKAEIRIADQTYEIGAEAIAWTRKTTIDALLQVGDVVWLEAEQKSNDTFTLHLRQEPEMEAALVMLESSTGAVRAMVGGWDYARSEFNRATQAKRQIGSSFKPFIFGAALEMGYTPADTLFDAPVVFRGQGNLPTYSPRNFTREYYGIMTLRRALEQSINVTTAKLLDLVGIPRAIDFARRSGIASYLPPYPSLALGAAEMPPLELAAAYATLANQGVRVEPYLIDRVTTHDGLVLEEHTPQASEVIDTKVAYVLTQMLEGVVKRGTGARLADLDIALAGKTGTTDFYTDAWFVGYTPRYTLLVWVGYDQNRYLGPGMTGAAAALPIWREMVVSGLDAGWLEKGGRFAVPPGVETERIEYRTGLLPSPEASYVISESFLAGTQPVQRYDSTWNGVLDLPWYQQRPFYGQPKAGERMPEDVQDWGLVQDAWISKDEGDQEEDGAESEDLEAP